MFQDHVCLLSFHTIIEHVLFLHHQLLPPNLQLVGTTSFLPVLPRGGRVSFCSFCSRCVTSSCRLSPAGFRYRIRTRRRASMSTSERPCPTETTKIVTWTLGEATEVSHRDGEAARQRTRWGRRHAKDVCSLGVELKEDSPASSQSVTEGSAEDSWS